MSSRSGEYIFLSSSFVLARRAEASARRLVLDLGSMTRDEDEEETACKSCFRKYSAVNWRKVVSPAVMPYCNASWPVSGERKTWFNAVRASATGKEALSVKPAAREISLGRDNAACMSHEMGGSVDRWPIFDKTCVFI